MKGAKKAAVEATKAVKKAPAPKELKLVKAGKKVEEKKDAKEAKAEKKLKKQELKALSKKELKKLKEAEANAKDGGSDDEDDLAPEVVAPKGKKVDLDQIISTLQLLNEEKVF